MKELLETGLAGDLDYSEVCDALIGRINGLSVAIKENDQTKSYGCLIWVGPTGKADPEAAEKFLAEQAAEKPHIIKNYRAAGRGAAIALVKYNEAERNIHNITRLMTEISEGLFDLSYDNCCYKCGTTEGLSLYSDKGVPAQYCTKCGRGTVLRSFGGQAVPAPETPVTETDDPTLDGLLIDGTEESAPEVNAAENIISSSDEAIDLSALLFAGIEEEQEKEAPRRSELFEAVQREYEEEQRREREVRGEEPDEALDSLMFVAGEEKPAIAEEKPAVTVSASSDISDLGSLMFDGTEEEPEKQPSAEEKAVEKASIDELMFGNGGVVEGLLPEEQIVETQAPAALGSEIDGLMVGEVSEVTAVTAIGKGTGEDLKFETEEEDYVGLDDNVAVTEIYDDSNEGEDIDITASEYDVNEPTDTTGEQLSANETPLEADGSVPLVNPNSGFADIKPSSAFGPGAVRAYVAGSYEGANIAEEPVGFDGRRKSDAPVRDPRLGDEMGAHSRDYRSQQVTEAKYKTRKTVEAHRVSGVAKSSDKTNYSYVVESGSKWIVGTIAALLFGLVGAGLWSGIGYLLDMTGTFNDDTASLILSICAFLPTLFVFVGYRIGGDWFDRKGIIISSVLSVIIDAAGMFVLFVTSELRWTAVNFGYSVSMDKAIERAVSGFTGAGTELAIYGRVLLIAIIMVISLAAGIVVANKRSE